MTPAIVALRRAGVEHRVLEFECDSDRNYGEAAAAALGVAPEHVYKTLIAQLDGVRLAVALVPVSAALNLKALAMLAGAKRAEMALAAAAERATGYVIGGISPFGQRRQLETFADNAVRDLPVVYVSGGRRGLEIELAPVALLGVCQVRLGSIARSVRDGGHDGG
jgi:Cys-tRNA(Pro)/Cys-tRNA(Cys) deacylase